jgi:hypothetical protein
VSRSCQALWWVGDIYLVLCFASIGAEIAYLCPIRHMGLKGGKFMSIGKATIQCRSFYMGPTVNEQFAYCVFCYARSLSIRSS